MWPLSKKQPQVPDYEKAIQNLDAQIDISIKRLAGDDHKDQLDFVRDSRALILLNDAKALVQEYQENFKINKERHEPKTDSDLVP